MGKWLLWTLAELTTVLVFALCYVSWKYWQFKRYLASHESSPEEEDTATPVEQSVAYEGTDNLIQQQLAELVDRQISHAIDTLQSLRKTQKDSEQAIDMFKLWGTLLKAERAILLNDQLDTPDHILNRFLGPLLQLLGNPSTSSENIDVLQVKLQQIESETSDALETLDMKEELAKQQKLLNNDLKQEVVRCHRRLESLSRKAAEQKRLKQEFEDAQKKLNTLQDKLLALSEKHSDEDIKLFAEDLTPHSQKSPKKDAHENDESFRKLGELRVLSARQQNVIDQLKSEIERFVAPEKLAQAKAAHEIAISRMERMLQESESLVRQLEMEMDSANLSISALKQDVSARDRKLKELESRLQEAKRSPMSSLRDATQSQKATLDQLRMGIENAPEMDQQAALMEDQSKEMATLERLLSESETCVELLEQELETAQKRNMELGEKLEKVKNANKALAPAASDSPGSMLKQQSLDNLRMLNEELESELVNTKQKLIDSLTDNEDKKLKTELSKKNKELSRLQLAYTDLERKYLKAISNH